MLVYSEKMRRISRNRFPQTSPLAVQQLGNMTKSKKRAVWHETEDTTHFTKSASDTKPGRPLRSLSDAAAHKALRGPHLVRAKKKTSLDMTGTLANSNQASDTDKECSIISSAWETSDCVYQRQRRRGVATVPKLEKLSIQDNSISENSELDANGNSLPSIYPHEFVSKRGSSNSAENSYHCESDLSHENSPFNCHSKRGVSWNDLAASRKCPGYSETSQLVLRSFVPEVIQPPESAEERFSDTSAAELKLLRKNRNRLASNSAPTSPVQSSDEGEEDDVRRRTHSLSIPCKALKSVLKKTNICHKKKPVVGNPRQRTVSFKSPDVIRVISRCSGDDWEETFSGSAGQSETTIVVISD